MSYYLKKGGREIGPMEAENIVALLQGGDCLPTDLIRREEDGDGSWVPVERLFPKDSWTRQDVEPILVRSNNLLAVTIRQLLNEEQDEGVSRKLVAALAGRLRRGDRVLAVSVQNHLLSMMHLVTEAIVATSERLLIVSDLILGKDVEEIDYRELVSISVEKELIGAVVAVEARGRRRWTIRSLPKESAEKVVRAARARKEQMSVEPQAAGGSDDDLAGDPLARLKKLKELLDQGVITEADYEGKKRDILPLI